MGRKTKSVITAGLLTLVLLITGAFAWASISQKALHKIDFEKASRGRLHDDYNTDEVLENDGNYANKDTWIPHFKVDSPTELRDYVTWELGGDTIFMPTFNQDNESLTTDVTGNATNDSGDTNTALDDGLHHTWADGDTETRDRIYHDKDGNLQTDVDATHTAKPTVTQEQPVMTMPYYRNWWLRTTSNVHNYVATWTDTGLRQLYEYIRNRECVWIRD